jgi:DNA-directed RNA polymerase subunit RPC12/RpoP
MSEFKYACPVCGQHISCDSSQAGTVMDCPTCFQKITVPQAPAEGQKLILTGSKFTEKPVSTREVEAPAAAAPASHFPGGLVVAMILVFMGTAAAAIYWATIIHPRHAPGAPGQGANPLIAATNAGAKPKPPPKPVVIAPPSNDTNWMLALSTNACKAIPATPAAGRVLGHDFIAERAFFQNGSLLLRTESHSADDISAAISFSGAQPEELAGKIINVTTNAEKAARVTLRWKDDSGSVHKQGFEAGYALHLEFGALAGNRLPGTIYLCTPDAEKSYILGTFNADARKPKPKPGAPPK